MATARDTGIPLAAEGDSGVESSRGHGKGDRRSRRRPEQVRALLLDAAARLIGERGVTVSTKEIALAAGVSENSLFRHFPMKADLIAAAVVDPFVRFVDTFRQEWENQRDLPLDDEALMRRLVDDLYRSLAERRGVAAAFVMTAMDAAAEPMRARLAEALDELFVVLRRVGEDRATVGEGFDPTAVELSIRLHVAMIMTSVVLEDVFLPRAPRCTADELIDHITRLNLYGVRGPR